MVNLADAIATLYPAAVPLVDYVVREDGAGPYLAEWSLPGPPPTQAQLASVTPAQVADARESRNPDRKALRQALAAALADNAAFLALANPTANPTAKQIADQAKAVTRQMQAVLRRLAQID